MAISKENLDFLFDIMNYYDSEYNKIADTCYDEVERALNEICSKIPNQQISVLPFGSYALKNNYQLFEPMEFFCVLKTTREVLQKETLQMQKSKKPKKRTIKDIYKEILTGNTQDEQTSVDTAETISKEMQKYVGEEDKVLCKNNVIFIKFKINDETELSVIIYIAYDFDGDGIIEYSKLGYKTAQNPYQMIKNIQEKNFKTNGNYLLLCKLIKMLEIELIVSNSTNILLSSKTLFVENILYNIPNELFLNKDFCEMFHQIVNYINQCDIEKFILPDKKTQMFGEKQYYANSHFKNFVNKLVFIYKNADRMILDAMNNNSNETMQNDDEKQPDSNQTENQTKINKINKNIN